MRCVGEIGILQHNGEILASELHRHRLEIKRRTLSNVTTYHGRTREVALPYCFVRDHSLEAGGCIFWTVLNEVKHSRREACLLEQLRDQMVRLGAHFGALYYVSSHAPSKS
jgi:hypothetical protein